MDNIYVTQPVIAFVTGFIMEFFIKRGKDINKKLLPIISILTATFLNLIFGIYKAEKMLDANFIMLLVGGGLQAGMIACGGYDALKGIWAIGNDANNDTKGEDTEKKQVTK